MEENIFSQENEEPLNPEREEQLQVENELLKLKIQAQFGGMSGSSGDLPPEIENEFLKHVMAFEQQFNGEHKPVKMVSFLGNPVFRQPEGLGDREFKLESKKLTDLLYEKGISVDFLRDRDDRFQYKFITEELFEHESDFGVNLQGMMHCFIYEEFHPDHEMDIEDRTRDFMHAWLQRTTEYANHYLAKAFIQPNGKVCLLEQLTLRLQQLFDSYKAFENFDYKIFEIKFQLHPDQEPRGLGHAEGIVKYDAILENGERKSVEGPFKLYLVLEHDWWSIFYFVMEGF
ncbi:MAG: hypothetical protein ABIO46_14470 [Chitinophagales bacterium]